MKIETIWKSSEVFLTKHDPDLERWLREKGEFRDHLVFQSSGSSGVRKWIALSKDALEWSARRVIDYLEMTSRDVCGLALPKEHVGGFGLALRAHLMGSGLAEFREKWQPEKFQKWCAEEGVTISSLVPTQVSDLVSAGSRAPFKMRAIVVGGGFFESALAARAQTLGWPVLPSYGMTETSAQIATGEGLSLFPGWEARIENRRLALKGGGLLSAIITREEGRFRRHDPKVDGWFLTQDRATLSGRQLTLLGRADRQVKILGKLVDLEALERFWREKLGREVALVSQVDVRRENSLILFFEGPGEDLARINLTLPGPERLLAWQALASLPRSALGKIDRASLRDLPAELRCLEQSHEKG